MRKLNLLMVTALLVGLVMAIGSVNHKDIYARDLAADNIQLEAKLGETILSREQTEADLARERFLGELRDGEISNLQSQTTNLKAEKARIQTERDGLAERAESLMAQVDAAKLDLDELVKQLLSAGDRARDLEALLKRRDERIGFLEAEQEQILLDFKTKEAKMALLETLLEKQNEKVVGLIAEQDRALLDLKAKEIEMELLEDLLEKQNKRVGSLESEQDQLRQEKTDLDVRIADLSAQIESMKNERSSPSWKSDRQEREIATFSSLLIRVAANQKTSSYRLIPVCFSANDLPQCSDDLILEINMAMAEVQAWYYSYVGKTFEWNLVLAMRGEQSSTWYNRAGEPHGGTWARAVAEVANRLPQSGNNFVYLIFFRGWKSSTAAALGGDERHVGFRFGFFGNTVINNLSEKTPEGRQLAVGTISHEIGHALGIYEHSPSAETVLGTSANIFGGFSEDQLRFLQSSSFLR